MRPVRSLVCFTWIVQSAHVPERIRVLRGVVALVLVAGVATCVERACTDTRCESLDLIECSARTVGAGALSLCYSPASAEALLAGSRMPGSR